MQCNLQAKNRLDRKHLIANQKGRKEDRGVQKNYVTAVVQISTYYHDDQYCFLMLLLSSFIPLLTLVVTSRLNLFGAGIFYYTSILVMTMIPGC